MLSSTQHLDAVAKLFREVVCRGHSLRDLGFDGAAEDFAQAVDYFASAAFALNEVRAWLASLS